MQQTDLQPAPKQELPRKSGMEILLFLVAIAFLVMGGIQKKGVMLFWGTMIMTGVFILRKLRRKDWAAHWADRDEYHRLVEQVQEQERNDRQ